LRFSRPTVRSVLAAGAAASTAYLAEQEIDRRLTGNGYDDLLLWGGLLTRNPRRQRITGLVAHFALGAALAAAYGVALPSLPAAPGWLRGLIFTQAENGLLYPGVPLINAIHPDVRNGKLPSLLTWRYFWVEVARHLAYGLVLGVLLTEDEESR
jgi:hypothetical protein